MIPSTLYLSYESFISMALYVISISPPYEQLLVGSMGKMFCWSVFAVAKVEHDNTINASIDNALYFVCIYSPKPFCITIPLHFQDDQKPVCPWRNSYHYDFIPVSNTLRVFFWFKELSSITYLPHTVTTMAFCWSRATGVPSKRGLGSLSYSDKTDFSLSINPLDSTTRAKYFPSPF